MKRRKYLLISVMASLAVLLWLWLGSSTKLKIANSGTTKVLTTSTSPTPPITALAPKDPQIQAERRKAYTEKIVESLGSSITFYGKVIDQNNAPVPSAKATYGTIDRFDASGSSYSSDSDGDGFFSITGIKGAVLTVGVRKEGYYPIHNQSNGSFAYGVSPDSHRKAPPTKENPAVFKLQKMGVTEPLINVQQYFNIPRNGVPVEISLITGKKTRNGEGDLRVEAWTEDQTPDAKGSYNWRCLISVPNGGITERKSEFAFEAPLEGYKPDDEIIMTKTTLRWRPEATRSYFLKLVNGNYARIEFEMIAGGNHYFRISSYLNPTDGSRNLEFDPKKTFKAP